ncbi:hypothetical protein F5141DRAFT_1200383 [Pisolithus sp. B1]|nr:hypothetical protein F5141DRAFT_1200383 [Pisolithus sp. B1]
MSAHLPPTPASSGRGVHFKSLKPGDLFWADLVLDPADIAYPGSCSAKRINNREASKRICIVLQIQDKSIEATYLATFDENTTLPTDLDKEMWYPFKPAAPHGQYSSLAPQRNGKAQWASLRSVHKVSKEQVDKLGVPGLPPTTVNAIIRAMDAVQTNLRKKK